MMKNGFRQRVAPHQDLAADATCQSALFPLFMTGATSLSVPERGRAYPRERITEIAPFRPPAKCLKLDTSDHGRSADIPPRMHSTSYSSLPPVWQTTVAAVAQPAFLRLQPRGDASLVSGCVQKFRPPRAHGVVRSRASSSDVGLVLLSHTVREAPMTHHDLL